MWISLLFQYELMQAFEAFSPVGCRIINNIDVLRR